MTKIVDKSDLIILQILVGEMENYAYVIGSKSTHEAAVIDPGWEADKILAEAKEATLSVEQVSEIATLIFNTRPYSNKDTRDFRRVIYDEDDGVWRISLVDNSSLSKSSKKGVTMQTKIRELIIRDSDARFRFNRKSTGGGRAPKKVIIVRGGANGEVRGGARGRVKKEAYFVTPRALKIKIDNSYLSFLIG